ncbi:MAG: hypothetical protein AB1782_03075 [Cyanobacteriota bacterium]
MSQWLAIIPFVVIVITVLTSLIVINWLDNKKIGSNLQQVADSTNGKLIQENGVYSLEGCFQGRNFSIYLKPRGAGKNKALYYHIQIESECELRMLCVKRYVKSRLEAKINEMTPIEVPDEDFNMVNKILVDNEEIGRKLLSIPIIVEAIKNIMEKYTEMRIKKDVTLLKRYHVKLTDPEILLNTLEYLSRIAYEIEKLTKEMVTSSNYTNPRK